MTSISDDCFAEWNRRMRSGDHAAFSELYQQTHAPLFRYAWRFLRDDEACYDVLHDVYLKLWNVRDRLDPKRSLKALLYRMTRNTALNHLRARQHRIAEPIDGPVHDPKQVPLDEQMHIDQLEQLLHDWIEEMPERRREAFCLSRFDGLSHEEIAEAMELAPKTVNNHIVLALQYLRKRLNGYEPA